MLFVSRLAIVFQDGQVEAHTAVLHALSTTLKGTEFALAESSYWELHSENFLCRAQVGLWTNLTLFLYNVAIGILPIRSSVQQKLVAYSSRVLQIYY